MSAFARSPAARWFCIPLLAALGYGVYEYEYPPEGKAAPTAEAKPGKPAAGKLHTTMTVRSAKQLDSGFTILNDSEDYSAPSTQTVVCDKTVLPKGFEDGTSLIGKQVEAVGRSATYKGRQQLRASKVSVK